MSAVAVTFQIRRDRLPDATAYEDIRERRVREELRLREKQAELSVVEQKIQERDRLIAEVGALQERVAAINLELESLGPAQNEIEETKRKAAKAAEELALQRQELESVTSDLSNKREELRELDSRLSPDRIAQLEERLTALRNERAALDAELPNLRAERDGALQRIEEARSINARKAAFDLEIERLEDELDRLIGERGKLSEQLTELQKKSQEYATLANEVVRLEARHARLEEEVSVLENKRDRLSPESLPEDLASDLEILPACLKSPGPALCKPLPEFEALAGVQKYLREHGLDYSPRTVRAFHTCLKINDSAQITVLAGVSGTGKSLLPRRYAEAMGIHFHQIAVEPRWDSPQDLLGFYNYIEKKYRATDLARLLVYMDPYHTARLDGVGDERTDHVALVLLDEMNLARVEYYFSEFLSRLEVRPRFDGNLNEEQRRASSISVDIRGLKKGLALFPSHNVLFAGTMNDDESTQSLSDKVLDRGNVLQFAAPKDFKKPVVDRAPEPSNQALSFTSWRGWVKQIDSLREGRQKADEVIAKLADIMENCGRPFGHRLRDSILTYAANYPNEMNGTRDVGVPLADQIEFRIMPKLRGLEIEPNKECFDRLHDLIRGDLGDQQLAERLMDLLEKQDRGTGLFVWRGLTRPAS